MEALTHFSVGMTMGLLFIAPLVDSLKESTVMIASGVFAMVPDIDQFIGQATFLFDGWWGNVFWFHNLIDANETGHPNVEMLVALIVLCTAVALIERRNS